MSGWAYSHERDTPALAAAAAKVTGAPVRSSSRSAWTARARVSSCRCLAAATMGAALSGRIGLGLLGLVLVLVRGFLLVFFQRRDDALEAGGDLAVHLGHAGLPAGLGGGDDLQGGAALGTVLGQELGGGDEYRAGRQAGVGVRAGLLDRQPAVAVGQCLGRAADPLPGPRGAGERPVGVQRDVFARGVDFPGVVPVAADGGVGQPGIVRGHRVRVVVEDPPDNLLRDIFVDQGGAEGVPPLVGDEFDRSAVFVVDVAELQPLVEGGPVGTAVDRLVAVQVGGGAGTAPAPAMASAAVSAAAGGSAGGVRRRSGPAPPVSFSG